MLFFGCKQRYFEIEITMCSVQNNIFNMLCWGCHMNNIDCVNGSINHQDLNQSNVSYWRDIYMYVQYVCI